MSKVIYYFSSVQLSSPFRTILSLCFSILLKRILAFALLLILSVQCFHKAFVVLSFYWNQSYIAKTLCENRDKPKLKCGGKCQLMKQMAKEEKKEQQMPNLKWDGKEQVLSSNSFFGEVAGCFTEQSSPTSQFSAAALVSRPRAIFHPPGC